MGNAIKTKEQTIDGTKYRFSVHYDESPENPRKWSNSWELHFNNFKRETLPEELGKHFDFNAESIEALPGEVVGIYFRDYGSGRNAFGIDTTRKDFEDCDGIAHLPPEMAKGLCGVKDARSVLVQELYAFQQWANGEVYGFTLEKAVKYTATFADGTTEEREEWRDEDSCWGFYGYDAEEQMLEHLPEEVASAFRE